MPCIRELRDTKFQNFYSVGDDDNDMPPETPKDMNGIWNLYITIDSKLNPKTRIKSHWRQKLEISITLKQSGNSISGEFLTSTWRDCSMAEISGKVNSGLIEIEINCSEGMFCRGGKAVIKLKASNDIFLGTIEPSGNQADKCFMIFGDVRLERKSN